MQARRVDEMIAPVGAKAPAACPPSFEPPPLIPEPSCDPVDHRLSEET